MIKNAVTLEALHTHTHTHTHTQYFTYKRGGALLFNAPLSNNLQCKGGYKLGGGLIG